MSTPRLPPRAARVVRGVGVASITAGVLVLLFAAYQLWGTGLQHARAQDDLEEQFEAQLAEAGVEHHDEVEPSTTATTDPATTTTLPPEIVAGLVDPQSGDPVARIEIPAIGVDEIVVHGVSVADLRMGPGHYPGSAGFGEPGNAAIAGHRTTYGQPFHDLDQLEPGDRIDITTVRGRFTYRVMAHPDPDDPTAERGWFVVGADGVEVLDDVGDDRLTLTACHPKFSSRQRIIVTAELLDDPIEPLPSPSPEHGDAADPTATEFGEGLDGDGDVLAPMLLWSGAFLVALVATAIVAARWRRWPTYAIAAPVLIVLLLFSFEQIDRYLPAY